MKRLSALPAQIKDAPAATKVTLAVATVAILGLAGVSAWRAGTPHYVTFRAGLDASQAAACERALAEAGIRHWSSDPPGPFVIKVDESERDGAQQACALAGALEPGPRGIPTSGGGASNVFKDAAARFQELQKREWEECEELLESLDFVVRAKVNTSGKDPSAFRRSEPPTVTVSLTIAGGVLPSPSKAETVAAMVQMCFKVPRENIVITDQAGDLLFDGTSSESLAGGADERTRHKMREDDLRARRVNTLLDQTFGDGLARVTVDTEWSYDRTETIKETIDPTNKVTVSETTSKTKTPQGAGGGVGGPAGFPGDPPGLASATPAGSTEEATTSDSTKSFEAGRETTHLLSQTPRLERMSMALLVDDSLEPKLAELTTLVQAAVGFDRERGDLFQSMSAPFATLERDENGVVVPPRAKEPAAEPNVWLALALEHGLEALAALTFLFFLVRGLKSARRALSEAAERTRARAAAEEKAFDPELVARTQVEGLVKSDPERVGAILARWASDERTKVGAGR